MTISSTDNRKAYTGDGVTTVFSFPYRFLANADLTVISRVTATGVETTKTLTTHYTLTGAAGASGGNVTMLVAPAVGTTLTIINDPDLKQEVDLVENDPLPAETVEGALDLLTIGLQRVRNLQERSVKLSDGFAGTFDPTLPADLEAGALLRVNDTNTGLESGPTAIDIEDAEENAALAVAAAAAAALSNTASGSSSTASAASAVAAAASAAAAAAAVASAINNTAMDATHNGDTTHAPTKNVVYDALVAMLAIPRVILAVGGSMIAGKGAATYGFSYESQLIVSGTGTLYPLAIVNLTAAKFPSIFGLTPKFRIRWDFATNDVIPSASFDVGLSPVTRPATSGGAGLGIYTLGALVSGSNSGVVNIAPVDVLTANDNAEFALPADGYYAIGCINNATLAASSHVHLTASLEVRYT